MMGGVPADIYVRSFKITDDASKFEKIELAEYALNRMQEELDKLYAEFDENQKRK